MTVLQENYTFALTVGGTDYIAYLLRNSLAIVQGENNAVATLTAQLENYDGSLNFFASTWQTVYYRTVNVDPDDDYYLFGGYLVSATPEYGKALDRAVWTLKAEGWSTLFDRVPAITKTYTNKTCKYIIGDLFQTAGLTVAKGWDYTTHVATGDTQATFEAQEETLGALLQRLVALAGVSTSTQYNYWVTPQKALHFGPASAFAAPFGIAPLATANWVTTFPALKGTARGWEEAQIERKSASSSSSGASGSSGSSGSSGADDSTKTKWF